MVDSLLCDAKTCAYNTSRKCTAPAINIVGGTTKNGSDTFCATFTEDKEQAHSAGSTMVGDLEVSSFNDAPGVACNAVNCTYNDSNMCYASGVKILGQKDTTKGSTECETFRPE